MFSICRRCILTSSGPQTLRSRFLNLVQRSPHRFNSNLGVTKEKDIILYRYERPWFFITINFCAWVQLFSFVYFEEYIYSTFKNVTLEDTLFGYFFGKVNLTTESARKVLSAADVLFGVAVACGTFAYTIRSVRYLILHKGSQYVSLVTYMPVGGNTIKVPLHHVTTVNRRSNARKYIAVNVLNCRFYYLLHKKGEFRTPSLFDSTIGVRQTHF